MLGVYCLSNVLLYIIVTLIGGLPVCLLRCSAVLSVWMRAKGASCIWECRWEQSQQNITGYRMRHIVHLTVRTDCHRNCPLSDKAGRFGFGTKKYNNETNSEANFAGMKRQQKRVINSHHFIWQKLISSEFTMAAASRWDDFSSPAPGNCYCPGAQAAFASSSPSCVLLSHSEKPTSIKLAPCPGCTYTEQTYLGLSVHNVNSLLSDSFIDRGICYVAPVCYIWVYLLFLSDCWAEKAAWDYMQRKYSRWRFTAVLRRSLKTETGMMILKCSKRTYVSKDVITNFINDKPTQDRPHRKHWLIIITD